MLKSVYVFASLPDHCYPANNFLSHVSSLLGTCIPTPLAFLSTLFGTLSILSWLFAQAPQCVKNYRLKTAAGLSIYFLVEWLLGDLSNLFGAVLTKQATWQIIVATYYCIVDIILVSQWLWYEQLHHGRRLRLIWSGAKSRSGKGNSSTPSSADSTTRRASRTGSSDLRDEDIRNSPNCLIDRSPNPDLSPLDDVASGKKRRPSSENREGTGWRKFSNSSASPRTVLLMSMLVCLARASPMGALNRSLEHSSRQTAHYLGPILSWASTLLYMGSRIPQIVKNFRRRSTAGLSPLLFAAAFCGNFFYSASMVANPCAWSSYPPFGGRGWVREEGSIQVGWIQNALPFFLGAAGVLAMDASVGIQFWVYGENQLEDHEIIVVESTGPKKWHEVTGWMRGWKPTVKWTSRPDPRFRSLARTEDHNESDRLILSREDQPDRREGYGSLS